MNRWTFQPIASGYHVYSAEGRTIVMNLINVAIFGASGYSGEELVRRLVQHPLVQIVGLTSRQHVGKKASDLFPWLDPHNPVAELRFFLLKYPVCPEKSDSGFPGATPWGRLGIRRPSFGCRNRVLDLSADFRTRDPETIANFIIKNIRPRRS